MNNFHSELSHTATPILNLLNENESQFSSTNSSILSQSQSQTQPPIEFIRSNEIIQVFPDFSSAREPVSAGKQKLLEKSNKKISHNSMKSRGHLRQSSDFSEIQRRNRDSFNNFNEIQYSSTPPLIENSHSINNITNNNSSNNSTSITPSVVHFYSNESQTPIDKITPNKITIEAPNVPPQFDEIINFHSLIANEMFKKEIADREKLNESLNISLSTPIMEFQKFSPQLCFTKALHFPHYSPLLGNRKDYYHADFIHSNISCGVLTVAIAAFNESAKEVQVTLKDLYEQHCVMKNEIPLEMHCCLILDGWSKASKSLKALIKQWFPNDKERIQLEKQNFNDPHYINNNPYFIDNWHNYIIQWEENENIKDIDTIILQRRGLEKQIDGKIYSVVGKIPIDPEQIVVENEINSHNNGIHSNYSNRNTNNNNNSNPSNNNNSLISNSSSFLCYDIENIKLTVIIKRDNRRKHNSHEWFFSFAPVYSLPIRVDHIKNSKYLLIEKENQIINNSNEEIIVNSNKSSNNENSSNPSIPPEFQYEPNYFPRSSTDPMPISSSMQICFLGDTGTRYEKHCLLLLVDHLLANPDVVACSGRQRVMEFSMQFEAERTSSAKDESQMSENASEGLFEQMYRAAQGMDYESSVTCFNGAFSAFGAQSVIP